MGGFGWLIVFVAVQGGWEIERSLGGGKEVFENAFSGDSEILNEWRD